MMGIEASIYAYVSQRPTLTPVRSRSRRTTASIQSTSSTTSNIMGAKKSNKTRADFTSAEWVPAATAPF